MKPNHLEMLNSVFSFFPESSLATSLLGLGLFALFFFAFRSLLSWYLKIDQLQKRSDEKFELMLEKLELLQEEFETLSLKSHPQRSSRKPEGSSLKKGPDLAQASQHQFKIKGIDQAPHKLSNENH